LSVKVLTRDKETLGKKRGDEKDGDEKIIEGALFSYC
jgi:hypothetical protein